MECSLEPLEEDSTSSRDQDIAAAHEILTQYGVTLDDVYAHVDDAESAIVNLWAAGDESVVDEIASRWVQFCLHGVAPSDIKRLIEGKSQVRADVRAII